MIIYPAIDLKDGVCVRLLRGDMDRATIFNTDPARQALDFQESGFQWLHQVDLNGAIEGRSIKTDVVTNEIKSVDIPVQLGGGIRTMKALEQWFSTGVSRAVLGTAALADPDFVQAACREFEGRVVVAIDARDGRVAIDGWTKDSGVRVLDLALRFEDCGAAAILYTDINRDGAMNGVNVDATVDLAFAVTTPVIASGGVSSLRNLRELKDHEDVGINGVIVGRALYDGRIDPVAAIKAAAG